MRRLLAAAALASVMLLPAPAGAQTEGKMRIVGHAVIEVAPDFVVVSVGVSTKAPAPTAALDQNSVAVRKIIDFSKQFGVDARDIQTNAIVLSPVTKSVRDPSGGFRQEPDGYTASNTVRIKLSDLSRLGTFMRQVVDQGATNVSGVYFGLSDREKVIDEARQKAVEDAARQAQRLADAAKVKLGRIQEIVHPLRADIVRAGSDGVADMPIRNLRAQAVPIEAGRVEVAADVEVVWAIE